MKGKKNKFPVKRLEPERSLALFKSEERTLDGVAQVTLAERDQTRPFS